MSRHASRHFVVLAGAALAVTALAAAVVPLAGAQAAAKPAQPPNFIVTCTFSHRLTDDPIVFPNLAGRSHSHDFFGNTTTKASSTLATLLQGGTSCDRPLDTAAYWMPTAYLNGQALRPVKATIYYRDMAANPATMRTIPAGLKMLAGNPMTTLPQGVLFVGWTCTAPNGSKEVYYANVPRCLAGEQVSLRVRFPECWDGVHLDSADHRSHLAFATNRTCPSDHPVMIPRISITAIYPSVGGSGITLASGSALSGHSDFINSWHQSELDRLVRVCLQAGRLCGRGT